MAVARGRLGLPMPEQLADDVEAISAGRRGAGELVPESCSRRAGSAASFLIRCHGFCTPTKCAPGRSPGISCTGWWRSGAGRPAPPMLQVGGIRFSRPTCCPAVGRDLNRIDPVPSKGQDLRQAGAREKQEPERSDRPPVFCAGPNWRAARLCSIQRVAQPCQLLRRQ